MVPLKISVAIDDKGWPKGSAALVRRVLKFAAGACGAEWAGAAEISVLLTSDGAQKRLNRQWRDKDSATNVLSFPQIEPFGAATGLLGDISLALQTVQREAAALTIPFEAHFSHLLVHGFLHLLGYDHSDDFDAARMEGLETEILAGLGIAGPYD